MEAVLTEARHLLEGGQSPVLATIVRTWGSTPQKAGAKYLVRPDGSTLGTLGGGCVEAEVWAEACAILKGGRSQLREFDLSQEIDDGEGLVCGGRLRVLLDVIGADFLPLVQEIARCTERGQAVALVTCLHPQPGQKLLVSAQGDCSGSWALPTLEAQALQVAMELMAQKSEGRWLEVEAGEFWAEAFSPPPLLVIAGAGHIAQALCPLAKMLGFRVFIVDERPELAKPQLFPQADGVVVGNFASVLPGLPITEASSIVIATPGHKQDQAALAAAAATPARYVGLVGSRRKGLLILQSLTDQGYPLNRLQEIRVPVGLDIRARTPQEIALSIMAEVLMFHRGGQGHPLKLTPRHLSHLKPWSQPSS